ncbi:TrkA C-terminal domain-containing protein [Natrarchaeobius oligotrophus]|uniref:RCK C-terminal domain-containing protein n=1 Tax=Natrarchaeobius chitinivorans TaxID=1679083 RepID=A0A3N6MBX4_NATCH|nr:TrkA C-terminal domain-containing protein [Natrarchaeobius chitinivorans]RQH01299.1 hypothetical protein EA472_07550 [Natrarchaeobius chitinivorans]
MILPVTQLIAPARIEVALVTAFGLGLLAGVTACVVAFGYRRFSTRPAPRGVGVLAGVAVVGLWFTAIAIQRTTGIDEPSLVYHATFVFAAFVCGTIAGDGGRRIGDALACHVFRSDEPVTRGGVASSPRSTRPFIEIRLPDTIDDCTGYSTVDESIKRTLAGQCVLLPHRLSTDEIESRLQRRLTRDCGVEYADVTFDSSGGVQRLCVGCRRTGIGPTLPPETIAVGVRTASPLHASVGDSVEVWDAEDEANRLVATGVLRAVSGTVATITTDSDAAVAFDVESRYRVVTRASVRSDVYGLVSTLGDVDETVTTHDVTANGPLEAEFVDWLPGTVLVLVRGDDVVPLPASNVSLEAGDVVYVLGTPSESSRLESDARISS